MYFQMQRQMGLKKITGKNGRKTFTLIALDIHEFLGQIELNAKGEPQSYKVNESQFNN